MTSINNYGFWNHKEECFCLEKEPPRKWINLHYNKVGDKEIFCEATNIGDGVTCVRDYDGTMYDLISYDSKYLYIRNEESGTVFSPAGCPVRTPVENFSCKYFREKTEISGTCEGIKATQRIFIPKDFINEIWTVTLENLTDKPKEISVFAYALFQVSGYNIEREFVSKENFSEVLPEIKGVLVTNRNQRAPNNRFKAYLTTINDEYYGGSGYRDFFTRQDFSLSTPRILDGWNCDNRGFFGPDCTGIVQVKITIPPNSTKRADFLIGQAENVEDVKSQIINFTPEKIDAMCEEQKLNQQKLSNAFAIETGHENIDAFINYFAKKQVHSYLVHKAGFRDNVQVDNCLAMINYDDAKQNILRALASQFPDGSIPHSFRPMNRKVYADEPGWILQTIPGMIKESGDFSILDEIVPFFESEEKGTVWNHMVRGMRHLASDLGKNGLCDQHVGDWNDGLEPTDEAGERESVMVTQQLCLGCKEVAELAKRIGEEKIEKEANEIFEKFNKKLNDFAWDGEWYVRTVCADGYKIGSHTAEEAKIFMNTQSWAVLSETASPERAKLAMDNVEKYCKIDVGYKVLAPNFTKYDPRTGFISNCMPGTRTNGGCYNHAAGFKGVADCMLGRAEQAWETFIKVAPDNPDNPVSNSGAEPFSFVNFFSACEYCYGNSGYAWRTGTSGWFTMLIVEWILGARRSYDGLLIDPCLTKTIPNAKIIRNFRGAKYNIEIDNTAGRCKGATSITVDGEKIEGNVLPIFENGEHEINVVI